MAATKGKVRGILYNLKSVIDGLIKMLESDVMSGDQAINGFRTIAKTEFEKLNQADPDSE